MDPLDKNSEENNCPNQRDCIEMLQLIIDGQATQQQRNEFLDNHLEKCMPCFKTYHLEMALKDLIKAKCNNPCPEGLVDQIKAKINTLR